jgi:hypothetical protein
VYPFLMGNSTRHDAPGDAYCLVQPWDPASVNMHQLRRV